MTKTAKIEKQKIKFWKKISIKSVDECWLWTGYCQKSGHGKCRFSVAGSWWFLPHRLAYFFHFEINPKQLKVCHKCDNPPCCNPNHLFLGTQGTNIRDMRAKGRGTQGETHPFAKLSDADIKTIRELYADKIYKQYELGVLFGVTQSHISSITRGKKR